MEYIRYAVERAKKAKGDGHSPPISATYSPRAEEPIRNELSVQELNPIHLESKRIVAHDITNRNSKPYDILRTQVLRTMQVREWQLLAVTSPTPACGKTLTAINLALSLARQPDRSVLLIDMDLQRPQVAATLGLRCDQGLLGVLEGRVALPDALCRARAGQNQLMVLPCEASTSHSSEWMSSREMHELLQSIRRVTGSPIVILDLPPILPSDDVISILPEIDCVLLVAAVGVSTVSDIEQSKMHLRQSEVVKMVLNKSAQVSSEFYY